jgi:hypothetical protein
VIGHGGGCFSTAVSTLGTYVRDVTRKKDSQFWMSYVVQSLCKDARSLLHSVYPGYHSTKLKLPRTYRNSGEIGSLAVKLSTSAGEQHRAPHREQCVPIKFRFPMIVLQTVEGNKRSSGLVPSQMFPKVPGGYAGVDIG